MSEDFEPYVRAWCVDVYIDDKLAKHPPKEEHRHWFLTWEEAEKETKRQILDARPEYTWETDFNHGQTDTRKVFIAAKRDWSNPIYIDAWNNPIVNIFMNYKECHPEIMQKVRARPPAFTLSDILE